MAKQLIQTTVHILLMHATFHLTPSVLFRLQIYFLPTVAVLLDCERCCVDEGLTLLLTCRSRSISLSVNCSFAQTWIEV